MKRINLISALAIAAMAALSLSCHVAKVFQKLLFPFRPQP